MNRRLIRPEHGEMSARRGTARPRKKQPPPKDTHAEAGYYLRQMGTRTPMVVVLSDGEELRGVIEWYDAGCIKLNRDDAPNLLVQKHCIKYLYKEPGAASRRSR